jgi:hypothetical protein
VAPVALPSAPMMVTVGREAIVSRIGLRIRGRKSQQLKSEKKSLVRWAAQRWSVYKALGVEIERLLTSGVGCWVSIVKLQKVRGPN